jgi:hypothetical protein
MRWSDHCTSPASAEQVRSALPKRLLEKVVQELAVLRSQVFLGLRKSCSSLNASSTLSLRFDVNQHLAGRGLVTRHGPPPASAATPVALVLVLLLVLVAEEPGLALVPPVLVLLPLLWTSWHAVLESEVEVLTGQVHDRHA